MAFFRRTVESFSPHRTIRIVNSESCENYTVYVIEVCIGLYKWQVRHRYSEFYDLHDKLTLQFKLDRNILPRKKFFGNQTEKFVCKRQKELESYLQFLLVSLPRIPYLLMVFLDFNKYEVHGITQTLSEHLFHTGDDLLKADKTFHITPLQIYALCTRLKSPEPTCEADEASRDLGHLLDFVTRVRHLQIDGCSVPLGASNINMNDLVYDLHCFKSLNTLELTGCNVKMMSEMEHLKKSLIYIRAYNSLTQLQDLLLVGIGIEQWRGVMSEALVVQAWTEVVTADFSHNHIAAVDESIKLLPRVERLSLRHNRLEDINNLQYLSSLKILDISHNRIRALSNLHSRIGNITALNLSWNKLNSLSGLAKVYSLQALDVSFNEISQVIELRYLSGLPCLERLNLQGNPVTSILDYRTTMFELFGERAGEICLDGQKANSRELDTVAVRVAMHKSHEVKTTVAKNKRKAKEVVIVDTSQKEVSSPPADDSAVHTSIHEQLDEAVGDYRGGLLSNNENQHDVISENTLPDVPLGYQPSWYQSRLCGEVDKLKSPDIICKNYFMLPETLPGNNDKSFSTYLMTECLDADSDSDYDSNELALHVMWCVAICYTNPDVEFPACVVVSTHFIHVFSVDSLSGVAKESYPKLRRVFCIPLVSLQRVAIGYDYLYAQIEESQVGERGVYTLLTTNSRKTNIFVDALKRAVRHTIPELDEYEDPNIVPAGSIRTALQPVLGDYEPADSLSIQLYMLVVTNSNENGPLSTHSVVITTNYIYLLHQDFVNQPAPTFIISTPANRPLFDVLAVFPVNGHVIGVHMYDDCAEIDGLPAPGSSARTATSRRNFTGFGVSLTFSLGELCSPQSLDIRMPTSCQRDLFLTTLMGLRSGEPESKLLRSYGRPHVSKGSTDRDTDTRSDGSSGSRKALHRHRAVRMEASLLSNDEGMVDSGKIGKHRTSSVPNLAASSVDACSQRMSQCHMQLSVSSSTLQCKNDINSLSFSQQPDLVSAVTDQSMESASAQSTCDDRCAVTAQASTAAIRAPVTDESNVEKQSSDSCTESSHGEPTEHSTQGKVPSDSYVSATSSVAEEGAAAYSEQVSASQENVENYNLPLSETIHALPDGVASDEVIKTDEPPVQVDKVLFDAGNFNETVSSHHDSENEQLLAVANGVFSDDVTICSENSLQQPPDVTRNVEDAQIAGGVGYPSEELLLKLDGCNDRRLVNVDRSSALVSLGSMSGLDLVNHFHLSVSSVRPESADEQLRLVLWTAVTLHAAPMHEIPSVVFLSTRAIYFVSDSVAVTRSPNSPSFSRSHHRHSSDELHRGKVNEKKSGYRQKDQQASSVGSTHLSCGVLNDALPGRKSHKPLARVYATVTLQELRQIHIGLFNQTLRLTTVDELVLSCVTRDHRATLEFIHQLSDILDQTSAVSLAAPSSVDGPISPDLEEEIEQDFYNKFSNLRRLESVNCLHFKHVRVYYPPDEAIADLSFLIKSALRAQKLSASQPKILFCLLCFQWQTGSAPPSSNNRSSSTTSKDLVPRTVILTDSHLALAIEDHVSYPLPEFVRILPDQSHTEIVGIKVLDCLTKVVLDSTDSSRLTFVFSDDKDEVNVDPASQHYSLAPNSSASVARTSREVSWTLVVQNPLDRDKLVKAVGRQWTEINNGEQLHVLQCN